MRLVAWLHCARALPMLPTPSACCWGTDTSTPAGTSAMCSCHCRRCAKAAPISGSYNFKDQSGLNAAANIAGYETGSSASTIDLILSDVINVLLSFVGVIFFVLIVYGGFTWMTSQGNDEKVKKAKGTIKSSVIGLIITLSAYVISSFLINYFWK